MKETVESLIKLTEEIKTDLTLYIEKGNKSAGRRARKNSLAFEKLAKQFRKDSVANDNAPETVG